MTDHKRFLSFVASIIFIFSVFACAWIGAAPKPQGPIRPLTIGEDLTSIDLCQAIPLTDIETVMRVKLVEEPIRYTLRSTDGTSGCYYEGPTDSDGERHFGYVILTPLEVYENQTFNQKEDVAGLGDGAYFNKGGDARQLWVKVDGKVAFVIGFGDVAREEGAKALARLLVAALE